MVDVIHHPVELSPGTIKDVLALDRAAITARVAESPYLIGPLLRIICDLQDEYSGFLVQLLPKPDSPGAKLSDTDLAKAIKYAAAVLELADLAASLSPSSGGIPQASLQRARQRLASLPQDGLLDNDKIDALAELSPSILKLKQLSELQQAAEREYDPRALNARLHSFVREQGGAVRFDKFMQEHQFSEVGFYSHQLNMGLPGQIFVTTPSYERPEYVAALSGNIFQMIARYLAEETTRGRDFLQNPFVFVEIGGGGGQFKTELLRHLDSVVHKGLKWCLQYKSIDINRFQLLAQTVPGTSVQLGSATKTGLADASVDFLFDEEVPDCFPHRLLRLSAESGKITHEGHIVIGKDSFLTLDYRPVVRDDEILRLEQYLQRIKYPLETYRYSSSDVDYWQESRRVLRNGGFRIMIDYTYELMHRMRRDGDFHITFAANMAYNHDITRGIDPERMLEIAKENGFKCRSGFLPESLGVNPGGRFILSARLLDELQRA